MIEKDKTYTYDEIKDIITKASAIIVNDVAKDVEGAGIKDVWFAVQMSLIHLSAFTKLNKILFKNDKEKEN